MNNFNFYNPTKIFFGENAIANLKGNIKSYNNILLVYDSIIKQIGIYDDVMKTLEKENKNIFELNGITPNPRLEKVYEGVDICKKNNVDFILAVGGGSTIDCAKAIALGSKTNSDVWNFYLKKVKPTETLPVGTILTISATGTEMNPNSVITKWDTKEKLNVTNDLLYPEFSILDPTYTYTVPVNQTVYGGIDMLVHVFEQYFSFPNTPNLSDNLAESIMKTIIENLSIVINDLKNYNARANLMWCGTLAWNRLIGSGKEQDWMTHVIENTLSGIFDVPHGMGIAVLFPAWMKYVYRYATDKFKKYAINIWNIDPNAKTDEEIALEGINKTKEYFHKLGAPTSLSEINISEKDIKNVAEKVNTKGRGSFRKIQREDVVEILKLAL